MLSVRLLSETEECHQDINRTRLFAKAIIRAYTLRDILGVLIYFTLLRLPTYDSIDF
jgi:hypothetical protein